MPSDDVRQDETWTIGRLLTWTTDYLRRRGSESPRLDAEVMLAYVLDWQRVQLYTHFDDEVGERSRGVFRDLVRRRAEGAPVAYLVGRKEFYSLSFEVSSDVLIPRPETEFVVVEFLASCGKIDRPRVVDVGTGSGCLAVACAQHHPSAQITAIDLSPPALELAARTPRSTALPAASTFVSVTCSSRLPVKSQFSRHPFQPALHPHRPDRHARIRRARPRAAPRT